MKKTNILALLLVLILLPAVIWAGGGGEATTKELKGLNTNPLSDYRVRQAIAYAIDMDTVVDTLLEGKARVADSMVPPGPWKPEGLNPYGYNPNKAKQLLKEAGWDANYTLDVVFYYGDQLTVDFMTAVQSYLSAVGMKIKFRKLEGDLKALLWTRPEDPVNGPAAIAWDLCYGASGPLVMQDFYGQYSTGAAGNSHTPSNPELDALLAAAKSSPNIDTQIKAMHEVQKNCNEYLPMIPLFYLELYIFESNKVNRKGAPYGNEGWNYDWKILDWEVTPDAKGRQVLQTDGAPVEFFQEPWYVAGKTYNRFMFDQLIRADAAMLPVKGALAAEYKVGADGKSLTLTLRDGIKWHDGSAITAEDIKWSIEYSLKVPAIQAMFSQTFKSLEGAKAFIAGSADGISGITIQGKSITLKFSELDPFMLTTFSQWSPLPKKYFEKSDPLKFQQQSFWQRPVGSGPFKIDKVEMNDYTTLVPFEAYYGGSPKIHEIVLYPSGENEGDVAKYAQVGKLDYGSTKSLSVVKDLEAMSHIRVTPVSIPLTRFFVVNKFPKK